MWGLEMGFGVSTGGGGWGWEWAVLLWPYGRCRGCWVNTGDRVWGLGSESPGFGSGGFGFGPWGPQGLGLGSVGSERPGLVLGGLWGLRLWVPGSWVLRGGGIGGYFGAGTPRIWGCRPPRQRGAPPEVQLKPRQQPFRLRRQWAELVLRLSDAPPGAVARGKAWGVRGGGWLWGTPHGVWFLGWGGRTYILGSPLWVWGGSRCSPPQMSRACTCAATSSSRSTRSWRWGGAPRGDPLRDPPPPW